MNANAREFVDEVLDVFHCLIHGEVFLLCDAVNDDALDLFANGAEVRIL